MVLDVIQILSIAIVVVALTASMSIFWMSWRNGISPMPSSRRVRRAVAEEINRLGASGRIVEAGSGWGTLAVHLAKHCEGWRVEGVENSPLPLAFSRFAAWLTFGVRPVAGTAGVSAPSVIFRKDNLYDISYRDAQAVVFYLYPGAMRRLGPILREQLAPGARIVSVCFALPGWVPERVVVCKDLYKTRVYVYEQPPLEEAPQAAFEWRMPNAEQLVH